MPSTFEADFEQKFLAFWSEVRKEGDYRKNTLNTFRHINYDAVLKADPGKFRNKLWLSKATLDLSALS